MTIVFSIALISELSMLLQIKNVTIKNELSKKYMADLIQYPNRKIILHNTRMIT